MLKGEPLVIFGVGIVLALSALIAGWLEYRLARLGLWRDDSTVKFRQRSLGARMRLCMLVIACMFGLIYAAAGTVDVYESLTLKAPKTR